MKALSKIWHLLGRHKYLITIAAFLLIICVLDENNLMRRADHLREIRELEEEIEKYRQQYERDSRRLQELTTDPDELEKVAREKYFMKSENEDVYIFEEDLDEKQKMRK